ncbi:MAG: glycosyltransferase family 9 protein [Candidatus Hydrogenedentes bacterium]|nr:glycosyltransferase family 9 protein [Candidatus Hydrogenedentota bacterium]
MINGFPRILIIRFSAIGDVVRVLPALNALRHSFPHGQIDWAVEQKSKDILLDHPALDQIHVFKRPAEVKKAVLAFLQFCKTLRDSRYDIVLDFHGIFKSGIAAGFTRAKDRFAFAPPRGKELGYLFSNHKVRLPSMLLNRVEENMLLCEAANARPGAVEYSIPLSEEVEEAIDAYVQEQFQSAKRIVALHAPVDRPSKQWPIDRYAALADMLLSDGRFEVLLTWGPGQRACVEKLASKCKRNPHIAPETPGLKEYACMIRHCALYVGGDTGPMHIAAAMDVPVVAIFGGTSPQKHQPYNKISHILYAGPKELDRNLTERQAKAYLDAITADQVYDACIDLLKKPR